MLSFLGGKYDRKEQGQVEGNLALKTNERNCTVSWQQKFDISNLTKMFQKLDIFKIIETILQ